MSLPLPAWTIVAKYMEDASPGEYLTLARVNKSFREFFLSDGAWTKFNVYGQKTDIVAHYRARLNRMSRKFKGWHMSGRPFLRATQFEPQALEGDRYSQLNAIITNRGNLTMDHFSYIEPNVWNLWATHTIKTVPEYYHAKKLRDRMPFKFPVDGLVSVGRNRNLYLALLKTHGLMNPYGSQFLDDREIAWTCSEQGHMYEMNTKRFGAFVNDKDSVMYFLRNRSVLYSMLPEKMQADRDVATIQAKTYGFEPMGFPPALMADKVFAAELIKKDSWSFEFLSKELQEDPDLLALAKAQKKAEIADYKSGRAPPKSFQTFLDAQDEDSEGSDERFESAADMQDFVDEETHGYGDLGVDPIYGMDLNMAAMQLENPNLNPFLAQMYEEMLGIDHFADEPYYDSEGYEY